MTILSTGNAPCDFPFFFMFVLAMVLLGLTSVCEERGGKTRLVAIAILFVMVIGFIVASLAGWFPSERKEYLVELEDSVLQDFVRKYQVVKVNGNIVTLVDRQ